MASIVDPPRDSKPSHAPELRERLAQWLAEHEDHEHNALPHVRADEAVQNAYEDKLYGWADELLALVQGGDA